MAILSDIQTSVSSFFKKPGIEQTKRYNLLSSKGTNYLDNILDYSEVKAQPVTYSFDDQHDFTTLSLTDEQAEHLGKIVQASGDNLELEGVFTVPPKRYHEKPIIAQNATNIANTATPGILVDIPKYTGSVQGIDVAVLDTLIVTNAPQLSAYKTKVVKSFVGDTPCEAHGTNVAEIIAQGFDPNKTDLQFKNFAVFDCNGSAATSTIASAAHAILQYQKGEGKNRKLVVNFSGGGPQSPILNKLFAKLAHHGIGVVVASGNSGQVCMESSPACAASNSALQSIGALSKHGDPVGYKTGQDLATYSNYATPKAMCVDGHYQGCYELTDPFTNKISIGCGTSFAAPVGTLRRVVYTQLYPDHTPLQVKKQMKSDTIATVGPAGTFVNGITPAMAFAWNAKKAEASGKLNANATAATTKETKHEEHKPRPAAKMA
ncbi:MAG TPA: S8 family serine peptidase [Gammaproteobacteria bacterium]|nr:S8 family serine peptidase [Gammaproteobacteria bacterium]